MATAGPSGSAGAAQPTSATTDHAESSAGGAVEAWAGAAAAVGGGVAGGDTGTGAEDDTVTAFEKAAQWAREVSRRKPTVDDDPFKPDDDDLAELFEGTTPDPAKDDAGASATDGAHTDEAGDDDSSDRPTQQPPPSVSADTNGGDKLSLADRIITSTIQARLRESESAYAEAMAQLKACRADLMAANRRATELEGEADAARAEGAARCDEIAQLRATVEAVQAELGASRASEADLRDKLADARASAESATVDAAGAREELAALHAERDAERENTANERAAAVAAATAGLDEQSKMNLAEAKAELERIWKDKLEAAVARERHSWENKHRLLLQDYKELEPRYKIITQQLEHKLANAEFDATMLSASKDKWKADLVDERAKHKASRKALKKARSEIVALTAKLDRGKQREAELTATVSSHKQSATAAQKQLAALREEVAELSRKLQETEFDVSRLHDETATLTAQWEGAKAACDQTENALRQAGKKHAATKADLAKAEERIEEARGREERLQIQLKAKAAAVEDIETTLNATMAHCDEQRREIEAMQAEVAALAAITASAALTLANTASTLRKAGAELNNQTGMLQTLRTASLRVRTVKIERLEEGSIGLDLTNDSENHNSGVRIRHIEPGSAVASVGGSLSVGDVIVAINGNLVLESPLDEVARMLEACSGVFELGVASADEVDDDDTQFWQQGDGDAVEWQASSLDLEQGGDVQQNETATQAKNASAIHSPSASAKDMSGNIVESATEAIRTRTEALAKQVAALGSSITGVCDGVKSAQTWVRNLTSKLCDSRRRASALAEKLRRCNEDLDGTSTALASTVLDLEARDAALDEAKQERETLEKAIQDLGAQLADVGTRATTHSIDADTARALCSELQKAKMDADADIERLKDALKSAISSKDVFASDLASARSCVSALEAELKLAGVELGTLRTSTVELSERHRVAADGETAMSKELISLQAAYDVKLETARQDTTKTSALLTRAQERVEELEASCSASETRCGELEAELSALTTEHATAQEELDRVNKALAAETEEREHLEAGLGEAINALALAQGDKAKVSYLEQHMETRSQEVLDLQALVARLEVQLEMAQRDVDAEKENVQFAQELLHQAGEDKARLERELEETRKDADNVKILLRAAEEQHLDDRRAADTHHRDYKAESATARSRLLDAEATLASERARLRELEALLGAAMQARDKAERALKAQHGRLRTIGPDGTMSETPPAVADDDDSLQRGVHAYQSTQNIIRAFKVFGMLTRNVVLDVPERGGLGMELAEDPDSRYVNVTALRPGGTAARSGEIHVGDCVICVNGHFMLDRDYAHVVTAISKAGRRVSLVLGSPDQMFEKDDIEEHPPSTVSPREQA